jgi:hypothetical protein
MGCTAEKWEFESRQGQELLVIQINFGAHLASYTMGTPRIMWPGVKLTTHLQLLLR